MDNMFRAIPTPNKVLAHRWEERRRELHHSKLRSTRATVDMKAPRQFNHLRLRLKRQQLQEDRFTEIERENRILLEKMSSIMNTRGREIDAVRPKSLNRGLRKRELLRVTVENQAILKRLQEKQPSYSVIEWEANRRRQEETLRLRCEFPYVSPPASLRVRSRSSMRPRSRASHSVGLSQRMSPQQFEGMREQDIMPAERKVVLKRGMHIQGRYFVVEVGVEGRNVWILANDIEPPESFSLCLPYSDALDIMGGREDFSLLLPCLSMEKGELVLNSNL